MGKKIFAPTLYPKDKDLNKEWFVRYWTKTVPAERLKVRVPNFPTLAERLTFAQNLISQLKKNPRTPQAVKDFVQTDKLKLAYELLEIRKTALEPRTYGSYKSHFNNLNAYCIKNKVRSLTSDVANDFLENLVNSGKHPTTVNSHLTTFNTFFNKLVEKKRIKENPFFECEVLNAESEAPNFYKLPQVQQLKKYMLDEKPFLWSAVRWIFYQFIRPEELRNLRISDIDFDDWRVKVKSTASKNSKSIWLPIMDGLKDELKPLCLHQKPQNYYVVGSDGLPSPRAVGKNFWRTHHLEMLEKFKYNTENYKMYGWKHTGVVMAYKAKIDIVEIKLLCRHADISETYNYMRKLGLIDFPEVRAKFPKI